MPKKVPFRVIYCTGWEDDYPPKDLEPLHQRMEISQYCLYPQELVVRIDPAARIRKLQLLSHQYMIASKIELFVGQLPSDAYTSVDQAQFTRLGYVSLSDNEQTGFRSRELKSVNLDCTGQLIKLVLHQNHINRLNLFNQVSLVALNLLADPLDSLHLSGGEEVGVAGSLPSHVTHYVNRNTNKDSLSDIVHSYLPSYRHTHPGAPATDPVLLGTINKTTRINPMDDLAFAIAQDPETAEMIRKLDTKKNIAVKEERFEQAKELKQVIDELQRIGEVLCRYEVEKKQAVEREDYDTAKEKKDQVNRIRQQVYDQLGVHGLLSGGGVSVHPLKRSLERGGHHPRVRNPPFTALSTGSTILSGLEEGREGEVGNGRGSCLLPPIDPSLSGHSPLTSPHHDLADERPLPTLVNKKSQVALETVIERGETGEADESKEKEEKPEPLTGKQLNEVPIAVEVFSMGVVEYVYAKQYQLREKGLHQVHEALSNSEVHSKRELSTMVKATVQILKKGLNDQVFSTFSASLELLKYLVGPYTHQHKLTKAELHFIVEKVVPILMKRTGDTSPRIHTGAVEMVKQLAQDNQLKGLGVVGPLLVEPIKLRSAPWKVIKSRLELLECLNLDPGLETGGLTVKKVMEFISPCLEHTNGFVRDGALRLTLDLYRSYGSEVRRSLPRADDSHARKKTLWKALFEGFDQIDGKPTHTEKEAAKLAAQRAQDEEIEKLRDQAKQLRELVAERQITTEGEPPPPVASQSSHPSDRQQEEEELQRGDEEESHADDSLDTTCVFCGEQRDDFDTKMEAHYLNDCPMLLSCTHCKQVIEISGLTRHWLTECEAKAKFKECPRCREAIHTNLYEGHTKAKNCRVATSVDDKVRCPLCHLDISAGDEGWKSHLMGSGTGKCLKNSRRKPSSASKTKRTKGKGIPRAIPGAGTNRTSNRTKQK